MIENSSVSVSKPKVVIVLGAHRSGTSAFTGSLATLGLELPKALMERAIDNERGFFESDRIVSLNERILEHFGTNWFEWKTISKSKLLAPEMNGFLDDAIDAIKSDFDLKNDLVAKDPRFCKLLPFWLQVFEQVGLESVCVIPYRNPLEVAQSLAVRDGFDIHYSSVFWGWQLILAEQYSRNLKRCFISYDTLISDWDQVLEVIEGALELELMNSQDTGGNSIGEFVTDRLRHHIVSEEQLLSSLYVPSLVKDIFVTLRNSLEKGQLSDEGKKRFDQIREDLVACELAYSSSFKETTRNRLVCFSMDLYVEAMRSRKPEISQVPRKPGFLSELESLFLKHNQLENGEPSLQSLSGNEQSEKPFPSLPQQIDGSSGSKQNSKVMVPPKAQSTEDSLRMELAAVIGELEALKLQFQSEINAIHASTSWRVTAPLRWLGRKVKGLEL